MNVNLHLAVCGVLVLFLIASFIYRKFIDDHEDHNIHLSGGTTDARAMDAHLEHCSESIS